MATVELLLLDFALAEQASRGDVFCRIYVGIVTPKICIINQTNTHHEHETTPSSRQRSLSPRLNYPQRAMDYNTNRYVNVCISSLGRII